MLHRELEDIATDHKLLLFDQLSVIRGVKGLYQK